MERNLDASYPPLARAVSSSVMAPVPENCFSSCGSW
jgi:hypothetical protein